MSPLQICDKGRTFFFIIITDNLDKIDSALKNLNASPPKRQKSRCKCSLCKILITTNMNISSCESLF